MSDLFIIWLLFTLAAMWVTVVLLIRRVDRLERSQEDLAMRFMEMEQEQV